MTILIETFTDIFVQGLPVTIITKSSEEFIGIFAGSIVDSQNPSYLLKMVKRSKQSQKAPVNGAGDTPAEYIGAGSDYSMIFNAADVAGIIAENVPDISLANSQDGEHIPTFVFTIG